MARGGFSGLFPDSSQDAYTFTYQAGSADTISWCDVQLTRDGVGICLPTLLLDNCTNIQTFFPNGGVTYSVNGVKTPGWFPVDYDFKSLGQVSGKPQFPITDAVVLSIVKKSFNRKLSFMDTQNNPGWFGQG